MKTEKSTGAGTGWELLETSYPYRNKMYALRQDRVCIGGEKAMNYTYMERAEAVIIVPVTRAGEIILIRQYRYPVDDWCLEVPAGGSHDTGDASLEDIVRKELQEEVGAVCDEVEYVTFFYTSSSFTDEKCHVYLALGAELTQEPQSENTENIEMQPVPAREAFDLARRGEIRTAPCALAILLCESRLRQLGVLSEQPFRPQD